MKKLAVYILLIFFANFPVFAQKYTEEQLKCALIYRLTQMIYWQNEDTLKVFRVFYVGENPDYLKEFSGWKYLKIKGLPVSFSYTAGYFSISDTLPQLVFVDKGRAGDLPDIFREIQGKNILLISDEAGTLDNTMINLFMQENNVQFQINKENLENAGFDYSPKLLMLGGQIDEVRKLYKSQEERIAKIRSRLDSLEKDLQRKLELLKKQNQFIRSQLDTISKQKELIRKQKQELALQQQEIARQKLYLSNLLYTIKAQKDTLELKKQELLKQKQLLDSQKVMLFVQQQKINQSKQLYDSIRAEIVKQQQILQKQKFLIEMQKKGLIIAISFLVLLLILAFIIFRNYQIKKRTNKILEQKNILINQQNEELKSQSEILKNQAEELKAQAEYLAKVNAELETLSLVASYTDNSVIIMNTEGVIQWANKSFEKFYGKELFTKIFNERIRLDDFRNIENFDEIISDLKNTKKSVEIIEKYEADGQLIWIQTALTPIFKKNKFEKIIAVDTNITKTKIAEETLSLQNKEIKQSITYASRIQSAVLPQQDTISQVFKEHFILYRPRDIVSGDFYWIGRKMNKIVFTAADCTGHGVQGAFMSMLGTSLLNSTVNLIYERYGIEFLKPAFILGRIRKLIIRLLHQSEEDFSEPKDGMDMSLCVYSPKENKLSYAGANNSIYLVRHKRQPKPEVDDKFLRVLEQDDFVLYEIKADKMPVGIHRKYKEQFTDKEFTVLEGDTIYLFSDGFSDQFGGPDNKKFMSKNLKKLLLSLQGKSMQEQKQVLEETLDYWLSFRKNKKHGGQTDDILIWGIRF